MLIQRLWIQSSCVKNTSRSKPRRFPIEIYILNYRKDAITISKWCRNMRDCTLNSWLSVLRLRKKRWIFRSKSEESTGFRDAFAVSLTAYLIKTWELRSKGGLKDNSWELELLSHSSLLSWLYFFSQYFESWAYTL